MEKNISSENTNSEMSEGCNCKCDEKGEQKTPSSEKQTCCLSTGPTDEERNRSASRMILSLCCFVAAMYFYMVPTFFTANITDFLRGVLTATFIFSGLVVFQSKSAPKSK